MAVHRVLVGCAVGMVALGLSSPSQAGDGSPGGAQAPSAVGSSSTVMRAARATRPLAFEENAGQVDRQVRYLARGPGGVLWLTDSGVTLSVRGKGPASADPIGQAEAGGAGRADVIRMSFAGSLPGARISAEQVQKGLTNYVRRRDASASAKGVRSFRRVRYSEVYPGIDVVFHGDRGALEYDLLLAPGADPAIVRVRFEGAQGLRVDEAGRLLVRTRVGELVQQAPVAWQDGTAGRTFVTTRFLARADGTIGFEVAAYDRARALVIDPTLEWANFVGGLGGDAPAGLAVDGAGHIVVGGTTDSADFPTTAGAFDPVFTGGGIYNTDLYVTKLSSDGTTILWSTFVGGSDWEQGGDVALDPMGNVYVCGHTLSADFPTTAGAYQPIFAPGPVGASANGTIVKLDPTGSNLLYATYLGGPSLTILKGIALDGDGNVYVTGNSRTGFPVTPGAFDATVSGTTTSQMVFAKLAPAGGGPNDLLYATYVSGELWGIGWDIAVDAGGDAYIAGSTSTILGYVPYPTTANAYKPTLSLRKSTSANASVFTKIRPAGQGAADLRYSTFIAGPTANGGGNNDAYGVAIDATGRAYVAGSTPNANPIATTTNAYDRTKNGSHDGFLVVIDPSKTGAASYVYATLVGGNGQDDFRGVGLDAAGRVLLTGWSGSTSVRYPTTTGAVQAAVAGGLDAVLTVLDLTQNGAGQLAYSTYFGGTQNDLGVRIAGTPAGGFVMYGYAAGGGGFPAGVNWPNDGIYGGGSTDGLLVKFGP